MQRRTTRALLAAFEVGAVLLVGSVLYLLGRPPDLLVFEWVSAIGLASPLASARAALAPVVHALPAFLLFSLPNALWAYAFTAAMSHVWSHRWSRASACWIAVAPLVAIGSEIGQALGVVPGTFDVVDLVLLAVGCALALRRVRASASASPGGARVAPPPG